MDLTYCTDRSAPDNEERDDEEPERQDDRRELVAHGVMPTLIVLGIMVELHVESILLLRNTIVDRVDATLEHHRHIGKELGLYLGLIN